MQTNLRTGLTTAVIAERRALFGANALPRSRHTLLRRWVSVLAAPVPALTLVAVVVEVVRAAVTGVGVPSVLALLLLLLGKASFTVVLHRRTLLAWRGDDQHPPTLEPDCRVCRDGRYDVNR